MKLLRSLLSWSVLPLLLGAAAPLPAQQPGPDAIVESARRLEQIRRERAELREEMTRIRSRVTDLSSEFANVQRQVQTSAELLDELEVQLASREAQIEQNALDLEFTRARLAEREAVLHQRLREIYKRGPLQTLQVLLGAESFSDLLNRYRYLLLIARHDRQLADEVALLERQLVARERALRTNALQLETAQRERESEYQQLQQLRAQQGLALTNVRTREQTATDRLRELEEDEVQVATLIASFETRRQGSELVGASAGSPAAAPRAQGPFSTRRGSLEWPLEGPILFRFAGNAGAAEPGPMGVGISAAVGAPVRSIAGGSVVLAAPFDRYGPSVVISHGAGYYSLYLYLQAVHVREGTTVQAGQPIGTVGGQATDQGPHLELQIRVPGGHAVDPVPWLTPR